MPAPGDADGAAALVREYQAAQRAPATYRAYESDWRAWLDWCRHLERPWQAARDADLAAFLAVRARDGTQPTTLARLAAGIGAGYLDRGVANIRGPETVKTLKGANRTHGWEPRRAKPLTVALMRRVVDAIPRRNQTVRDHRDRALLLVAWQGALRRGEAVALDWPDVRTFAGGIMLCLRRSKGARGGAAVEVPIIEADAARYCPIRALDAWRRMRAADAGAVFVGWHADGWGTRLSPGAMNKILRMRLVAAGIATDGYSTHSLRAGFLTSAALAGSSAWRLREHSRHRRAETLDLYIRDARLIATHPARGLL